MSTQTQKPYYLVFIEPNADPICHACNQGSELNHTEIGPDGLIYCEECFDNEFRTCDCCNEVHSADYIVGDDSPNSPTLNQFCRDCAFDPYHDYNIDELDDLPF